MGIPLSGPLPIVATVGRYPAVQLIGRIPIPFRPEGLSPRPDAVARPHPALIPLSGGCAGERGRLDTRYSPVRRSPSQVASHPHAAPRLACVKPVASVHPEPGSNSTLYNSLILTCNLQGRRPYNAGITSGHVRTALLLACVNFSKNFASQGLAPRKRMQKYTLYTNTPNFTTRILSKQSDFNIRSQNKTKTWGSTH